MELREIEKLNKAGLLEKEVNYLLNHNNRRLIDLLYRLDVHEEKVKEVMANKDKGRAKKLTNLILESCQQILHSRAKYSTGKNSRYDEV